MLSVTAEIISGEVSKRNYSAMTIEQIHDCFREVDARVIIKDNVTIFFEHECPLIELYLYLVNWYGMYKSGKIVDFNYNTVDHYESILHFNYCDVGTWQIDSVFKQCDSPLTVSSMEFDEVIGRFVGELDNLLYDPAVPITPKKRKSYFFSRFMAYTADWIIIALICLGIFCIALVVFGPDHLNFRMPLAIFGIAAFFILPLLKDMVFKDGSIGKKLFCLKIVDENTWGKTNVMQRVVRNVPFHLAGFNIFVFPFTKKSIGDLSTNTVVIKDEKEPAVRKAISTVLSVLLTCVIIYYSLMAFLASFVFGWGYTLQEAKYYSDPNSFIEVTAVCNSISISETCYLYVDDMDYDDQYGRVFNNGFRIDGKNSDIVRAAGIEEKLTPGTTFTFISSPDCYSNGYQYPIVALEVDGEILLDFDTGYSNLMKKYWWVKPGVRE